MKQQPIRVVEGNARPYEPFWQVRSAEQTGGDPEIDFLGYISEFSWLGDDVTPKKFKQDLYAAGGGGPIRIRMHCYGGEIFAASAIRAMLMEYPGKKTVTIEGICASAAVGVALAADAIQIYDTAYMMVHNPGWMGLWGYLDADTLQKFSERLRLFKEGLLNAYETRTKLPREQLSKMLDDETWMIAQQAVELGFADEVITGGSPIKTDMQQAVRNYIHVPPALLNAVDLTPRQEPDGRNVALRLSQERERLAAFSAVIVQGEKIMNLRSLLKQRVELLARADELVKVADKEDRDFTDAERKEYGEILGVGEETGQVGALDAKIEEIQKEREKLRAAAEKKFLGSEAIKPDASGKKTMKRSEFDALDSSAQAAFVRGGGKIEE